MVLVFIYNCIYLFIFKCVVLIHCSFLFWPLFRDNNSKYVSTQSSERTNYYLEGCNLHFYRVFSK